MKIGVFLLLFVLIFIGCTDENNELPDISNAPEKGAFSISLNNENLGSANLIEKRIDTIKSSRIYNIKLTNKGLEDINLISLNCNDTTCILIPDSIRSISGIRNYKFVEQNIALKIYHGAFSADGKTVLYLPSGENNLIITISGKSKAANESDYSVVQSVLKLSCFVQRADFEIMQADSLVDFYHSEEKRANGPDSTSALNVINYSDANGYTIRNTGNARIDYSLITAGKYYIALGTKSLLPNETSNISLPQKSDTSMVFLKVNSYGVVQDINKKLIFKNGISYCLLKNTK